MKTFEMNEKLWKSQGDVFTNLLIPLLLEPYSTKFCSNLMLRNSTFSKWSDIRYL